MRHRFTLTFWTLHDITAAQARACLLDALTSGGMHPSSVKVTVARKRRKPKLYFFPPKNSPLGRYIRGSDPNGDTPVDVIPK